MSPPPIIPIPKIPANQGSDVPPHPNPLPRGGEGTLVSPPPIIPIPKIPRIKVQTFPLTLTLSRAVERGLSCLLHQSSQSPNPANHGSDVPHRLEHAALDEYLEEVGRGL